MFSASCSAVLFIIVARCDAPFQCGKFLIDRILSLQACKLMIEIFRQPEVIGLNATFDVVYAPRVLLKSNDRVVNVVIMNLLSYR